MKSDEEACQEANEINVINYMYVFYMLVCVRETVRTDFIYTANAHFMECS